MTMEGSRNTVNMLTATYPIHETSEGGISEIAREHADSAPLAWEMAWIDIGGEG